MALLEQDFLLHVILSQDIFGFALIVLIRTILIHAGSIFEEKLAILGPSEGRPNQSSLEDVGVDTEHGN
jgi:hypothetical protein